MRQYGKNFKQRTNCIICLRELDSNCLRNTITCSKMCSKIYIRVFTFAKTRAAYALKREGENANKNRKIK